MSPGVLLYRTVGVLEHSHYSVGHLYYWCGRDSNLKEIHMHKNIDDVLDIFLLFSDPKLFQNVTALNVPEFIPYSYSQRCLQYWSNTLPSLFPENYYGLEAILCHLPP